MTDNALGQKCYKITCLHLTSCYCNTVCPRSCELHNRLLKIIYQMCALSVNANVAIKI